MFCYTIANYYLICIVNLYIRLGTIPKPKHLKRPSNGAKSQNTTERPAENCNLACVCQSSRSMRAKINITIATVTTSKHILNRPFDPQPNTVELLHFNSVAPIYTGLT